MDKAPLIEGDPYKAGLVTNFFDIKKNKNNGPIS